MDHSAGTGRGLAPRVMELALESRSVSGSDAPRVPAAVRTPSKWKTSGLSMALSLGGVVEPVDGGVAAQFSELGGGALRWGGLSHPPADPAVPLCKGDE